MKKTKYLFFSGGSLSFEEKRHPAGFSFTETMTVLGILVILAGVGTPQWSKYRRAANINKLKADSNTTYDKIRSCLQYARLHILDQSTYGAQAPRRKRIAKCNTGEKLGLIPCLDPTGKDTRGGQNISDSCSALEPDPIPINKSTKEATTDIFCVTLKQRKLSGCLHYDAKSRAVTKCLDPEDPDNPSDCNLTPACDKKKGYKCSSGGLCVCA